MRCDPRPLASQSGHLTGALTCLWPDDDRRAACDPCGHRAAWHDAAVRPPPEHHRLGNDSTSPTPAATWMCGGGGGLLYRNGRMGAGDDFALRVFPRTPSICYERRSELATVFRGSSAVEHPTVNRMVVGSNPTRGAKSVTLEIALDMPRLYRRWPRYQAGLVPRTCRDRVAVLPQSARRCASSVDGRLASMAADPHDRTVFALAGAVLGGLNLGHGCRPHNALFRRRENCGRDRLSGQGRGFG